MIVSTMKALMSPLAKDVLADKKASTQLRRFLANRSANAPEGAVVIEVKSQGRTVRVQPVVVPKAA